MGIEANHSLRPKGHSSSLCGDFSEPSPPIPALLQRCAGGRFNTWSLGGVGGSALTALLGTAAGGGVGVVCQPINKRFISLTCKKTIIGPGNIIIIIIIIIIIFIIIRSNITCRRRLCTLSSAQHLIIIFYNNNKIIIIIGLIITSFLFQRISVLIQRFNAVFAK